MQNKSAMLRPQHVSTRTLLFFAVKNILNRKLRSSLTILGIIIGIGSISFLISFGLGLQQLVTNNVIDNKSINSVEITTPNSRIIKLNTESVNKFRTFPHISKLGVQYSFPASLSVGGGGIDAVIYGIDMPFQDATSFDVTAGRLLKKGDANSVVVSQSALKSVGLNDFKQAIGKKVSILVPLSLSDSKIPDLKKDMTVVGVIDSGGNDEIFTSSGIFDVSGVPTYSQVKLIADDQKNIASLRKQVESSGFQTSSPIDTLAEINQLFKIFNFILGGFGAIGIIVAILGMFNTLTISLLERTKEIGLMITLGARKKDMRRLLLIESFILSFVGAVIGIVLSIFGGRVVNVFANNNASSRITEQIEIFSMPAWLMISLTLFMIVVGLLVAYYPARRAQKINPIEALRRE